MGGVTAASIISFCGLSRLIKNNTKPASDPKTSSVQSPITYSYVYLRVQPFTETKTDPSTQQLQFLIYLTDPEHQLMHTTVTQAVPEKWLAMWDEYEWVEDLVAEALRVGVEVIGQEYVVARMGWGGQEQETKDTEAGEAQEAGDGEQREASDTAEGT